MIWLRESANHSEPQIHFSRIRNTFDEADKVERREVARVRGEVDAAPRIVTLQQQQIWGPSDSPPHSSRAINIAVRKHAEATSMQAGILEGSDSRELEQQ